MRCESLADAIVELARTGVAGRGTHAAIESHLDTCASCAALLERERQLSQGLRALAATTVGEVPSDLAERRLLQAFDARQSTQPVRGVARIKWAQVAALMVLASGVLWWSFTVSRGRSDVLPVPAGSVTREPAPTPGQVAAAASNTPATAPASTAGPAPRRAPTSRRASAASRIVRATGFVAIPGAAGLPAFESGEIVRVEVPLASLPTYGIEILPDVQTDVIEADLLVGQDGQARAIRLVPVNEVR
jgi:hypothetical protein